jgi:hypothetical protein
MIAAIRIQIPQKQAGYSQIGKLRYGIEKMIEKRQVSGHVSTILREKCGLTAGTISHTAYAAKTYRLVAEGKLTEEEYQGMTVKAMCAMWAKSDKFVRSLDDAEIVSLVRSAEENLHTELEASRSRGKIIA